jgi:membrane-bound metal-dependent hydrolase YbcI (DUF457 family)
MLLLGHIGITIGIAWLVESKLKIKVDYRMILIGSLLPDILDKPVGMILLPLNNGRVFAHTLLFIFLILLLFIGLSYRKFLFLSFASFLHLLEDEMWSEPATLLWPLLGLEFPVKEHVSFYGYISRIVSEYTPSSSHTFISEVIGLIIILAFLVRHQNIFYLIRR